MKSCASSIAVHEIKNLTYYPAKTEWKKKEELKAKKNHIFYYKI